MPRTLIAAALLIAAPFAAAGGAGAQTKAPPPPPIDAAPMPALGRADGDAVCFASMAIASQQAEGDKAAKALNVASGYYLARLLARYPDDAGLRTATAGALGVLKTLDMTMIKRACLSQFGSAFSRMKATTDNGAGS